MYWTGRSPRFTATPSPCTPLGRETAQHTRRATNRIEYKACRRSSGTTTSFECTDSLSIMLAWAACSLMVDLDSHGRIHRGYFVFPLPTLDSLTGYTYDNTLLLHCSRRQIGLYVSLKGMDHAHYQYLTLPTVSLVNLSLLNFPSRRSIHHFSPNDSRKVCCSITAHMPQLHSADEAVQPCIELLASLRFSQM